MNDHSTTEIEDLFHVLLDNLPGALVYTDKNLNIVFCNDRFKEMYKVPARLLERGRPYAGLLRHLAENGDPHGAADA